MIAASDPLQGWGTVKTPGERRVPLVSRKAALVLEAELGVQTARYRSPEYVTAIAWMIASMSHQWRFSAESSQTESPVTMAALYSVSR